MKYAILIAAGRPVDYTRKVGWDQLHDTRAAAEESAARARSNPGWEAKIIELSADEAAHWHETPSERLARVREEQRAAMPKWEPSR